MFTLFKVFVLGIKKYMPFEHLLHVTCMLIDKSFFTQRLIG